MDGVKFSVCEVEASEYWANIDKRISFTDFTSGYNVKVEGLEGSTYIILGVPKYAAILSASQNEPLPSFDENMSALISRKLAPVYGNEMELEDVQRLRSYIFYSITDQSPLWAMCKTEEEDLVEALYQHDCTLAMVLKLSSKELGSTESSQLRQSLLSTNPKHSEDICVKALFDSYEEK